MLTFALSRSAYHIRILPADLNRGRFLFTFNGETGVPDGTITGSDDGPLAGFLVSDTVTVISGATRWVGRVSGMHSSNEHEDCGDATTIMLRRRMDEKFLDTDSVLSLTRRYAEMMGVTVEVVTKTGVETVNRTPVWQSEDAIEVAEFGLDLLGAEPLDLLPLKDAEGETYGVAYILPTSPPPRDKPAHILYREGLRLDDTGEDLLPGWAFFARCVLDVARMPSPEAVAASLRSWLLLLSSRQPRRLNQFVAAHHLALKVQAAHDPELARIIVRWLPLETTAGRLTLTELLSRTRHVRYAASRDVYRQLAPIAGRNVPFVNGGHLHDVKLLEMVPSLYEGVTVERVDPADVLDDLDDPPLSSRAAHARLLGVADLALAPTGSVTVMKSYEPASLPVIYLGDSGTLCLNYRSPIVQHLARLTDQTVLSRTVQLLHAQARLLGHYPLRGVDSDLLSGAMLDLVQLASLEEDLSGMDHG
ncbi:hypothetical protein [Longispora albida]|uniref:hypothetical protein n=1 Tax=Longispora albida TaxID=203523 RepID=UPI0012F73C07|nr:hypothetical protein [Longispora albida]